MKRVKAEEEQLEREEKAEKERKAKEEAEKARLARNEEMDRARRREEDDARQRNNGAASMYPPRTREDRRGDRPGDQDLMVSEHEHIATLRLTLCSSPELVIVIHLTAVRPRPEDLFRYQSD
jgi:hypothetical protein